MMFRSIVFLGAAIASTSASAGYVQNYVDVHGGCAKDAGVLGLLMSETVPPMYGRFLDKDAGTWTDEDVEEYRRVLTACIRLHPATIMSSIPLTGPIVAPPGAIDEKVDERMMEVISKAIEPARAARRQAEASIVAEQAMEADKERSRANAEREQARQKLAAAEAHRVRAREQEEERRAALQEQARQDREAASQAKKLAELEAPQIAATEQEASEAHRARVAAEKHLDAVRQQVATAQSQRASDDAAAGAAKAQRLQAEQQSARREREKREDAALAPTCAVSAKQFGQVAIGMTLREVRQTFVCVGTMTRSVEVDGVGAFTSYQWTGAKEGTTAITTLSKDRVVAKSQEALE